MKLKKIQQDFSICMIANESELDLTKQFCFVGKTDEEFSLVCAAEDVPEHTLRREDGWKAFRIEGELDFSLIGILAGISALLAEQKIGIFVVSTYRTDYVQVKKEQYQQALETLAGAGYEVA